MVVSPYGLVVQSSRPPSPAPGVDLPRLENDPRRSGIVVLRSGPFALRIRVVGVGLFSSPAPTGWRDKITYLSRDRRSPIRPSIDVRWQAYPA